MAYKRKLDEFKQDFRRPDAPSKSLPDRAAVVTTSDIPEASQRTTMPESIASSKDVDTANESPDTWEVVETRKSNKKKKKAKLLPEHDGPPAFRFSTLITSPLRINQLQGLVLYLLADGVAPQWVAVQQAKKIDQVVVLLVPGISKGELESFVRAVDDDGATDGLQATSNNGHSANGNMNGMVQGQEDTGSGSVSPEPDSKGTFHILPVKAPGDKQTGRLYSSLQAMLISPEPKSKNADYKKRDAFKPTQTPVTEFVHTVDELIAAEYPIHRALFTNSKDADLERQRREAAGQATSDGWVDTDVEVSQPLIDDKQKSISTLSKGLNIYAIDCEMVLTTDDRYSLARISVLNWLGKQVMDKHVKPELPVKDYFTQFSGVTEEHLKGVTTALQDIQKELTAMLTPNSVLVGHSLESDLNALKMTHPFVVDTSLLYPHPRGMPFRSSLKFLANKYLKREIQSGANGHDSVEDARAALDLVRLKCEKGMHFGVADAYGESLFTRLSRSGRKTAMIDYGFPQKGFGSCADVKIACQSDEEVTMKVVEAVGAGEDSGQKIGFIWGQLRDMEKPASKPPADQDGEEDGMDTAARANTKDVSRATVARLRSIYQALPSSTVLMVYPGPGDMSEVHHLQDMNRQYKREFKIKKWDELSVQWTDTEAQALKSAFDVARQGWVLIGVK